MSGRRARAVGTAVGTRTRTRTCGGTDQPCSYSSLQLSLPSNEKSYARSFYYCFIICGMCGSHSRSMDHCMDHVDHVPLDVWPGNTAGPRSRKTEAELDSKQRSLLKTIQSDRIISFTFSRSKAQCHQGNRWKPCVARNRPSSNFKNCHDGSTRGCVREVWGEWLAAWPLALNFSYWQADSADQICCTWRWSRPPTPPRSACLTPSFKLACLPERYALVMPAAGHASQHRSCHNTSAAHRNTPRQRSLHSHITALSSIPRTA